MVARIAHKNLILFIIALAQFMVILDVSIINVALPTIFRGLHFSSASSLQWVVTAYTLLFGGFLLLGGRAADLYGRKRIFMTAVLAFAVASLLGGIITQYLGWRWNFFVNVPVGIFVAIMAFRYIPESVADLGHTQLDLPGAVLVTLGLISLVYGFT